MLLKFVFLSSAVYCGVVVAANAWVPPSTTANPRGNRQASSTSLQMGLSSAVKRIRDSILNKERSREDLKIGIAGFYDRSSKLWEEVWGEVCILILYILVKNGIPRSSLWQLSTHFIAISRSFS